MPKKQKTKYEFHLALPERGEFLIGAYECAFAIEDTVRADPEDILSGTRELDGYALMGHPRKIGLNKKSLGAKGLSIEGLDVLIHELIEMSNGVRDFALPHNIIQTLATDVAQMLSTLRPKR